jgi:hypothetical protein
MQIWNLLYPPRLDLVDITEYLHSQNPGKTVADDQLNADWKVDDEHKQNPGACKNRK